jgi:hypothetical protein
VLRGKLRELCAFADGMAGIFVVKIATLGAARARHYNHRTLSAARLMRSTQFCPPMCPRDQMPN